MTSHWHSRDCARTSSPYFICLESTPLIFDYIPGYCLLLLKRTPNIRDQPWRWFYAIRILKTRRPAVWQILRRDHLLGLVFPTKTPRQDGLICTTIWKLMFDPPQETKGRERERDGSVSEDQHSLEVLVALAGATQCEVSPHFSPPLQRFQEISDFLCKPCFSPQNCTPWPG